MNYEVVPMGRFKRDAKQLAKKYRHIKDDLKELENILMSNPKAGQAIPKLKGLIYKIRIRNRDILKGKSGGYRVVYYLDEQNRIIFLITVYIKGEKENIRLNEILETMESEGLCRLQL